MDNKSLWGVRGDLKMIVIKPDHLVGRIFAKETLAAADMGRRAADSYDWIKQYLEVGTSHRVGIMRSRHRREVTAGRKALDSDKSAGDEAAENTHRLPDIAQRHLGMTIRHTVLQYSHIDALTVVPRHETVTFVLHSEVTVAAARTHQNNLARRL